MRSLSEFYRLAEREQVTVDLFRLTRRESMSLLDADGRCHIAIDPRRLRSERDERTKLVHELGHCLTGSFYSRDTDYDGRLRQENRADKWAIARRFRSRPWTRPSPPATRSCGTWPISSTSARS